MALAGQVALVTGSGRNMGKAIALALADAGANMVVNSVSDREAMEKTADEIRDKGVKAIAYLADVRDRAAVDRMVAQARDELGPIDILVNCPAPRTEVPFEEMSAETWRDMLSVVLDGAFNCSQAVIGDMLKQERGTILNLIGIAGQTGRAHRAHIIAAKTGLVGFTKALAYEYGSRGITANAVSPAFISRGRPARAEGAPSAEGAARAEGGRPPLEIPVGRQGRQDEVASLCCYLASDAARYITGQVYAINGGAYM
jgi:3-oxoacyl-[acyl-carrier protein] reductase